MTDGHISLNGSKAAGKTTLAHSLSQKGYGTYAQFFLERYEFQQKYLPVFYPNADLPHYKQYTPLLCFALDWHRRLKHIKDNIIFDHYYADCIVQLMSAKTVNTLLEFIEEYNLPSFTEGHHFFIDVDYDVYLQRRAKREKEHPEQRGHEIITQDSYSRRREKYMQLVDMGYLIRIDANFDKKSVYGSVDNILGEICHDQ